MGEGGGQLMDFFAWHLVVDAVLVTGIVSWIIFKNKSKKVD